MSLFSNFPQGGKKAGVQSISDGGTGATTAEAALANLGGFPKADGEALKTRIQPINLGGTGASEANQARQNLGAAAVKEMTKAEYDALAAIDPTIFYALTDVEADSVKIETGSYVGTGAYGASNPTSITAPFEIKAVGIIAIVTNSANRTTAINSILGQHWLSTAPLTTSFEYGYGLLNGSSDFVYSYAKKSEDGKTVYWYNTKNADYQENTSGYEYHYVVIG